MRKREFQRIAGSALLGGVLGGCEGGFGARIRVACEGDSITYGHKVIEREKNSYPGQLQRLAGGRYHVRNFGINGATLLANGDYPYIESPAFKDAVSFDPHIVFFMLGTNDTKRWNWKKNENFVEDGLALLNRHESTPECFVCLPPPVFPGTIGIQEEVIAGEVIPQLREIADRAGAEVLDLHTPLSQKPEWFPDGVHPSEEACAEMARITAEAIGRAAG